MSNDDRSSEVVAASVVLLILPTIAVLLRILSRWMAKAGFWWDDYTIIAAMILAWGPNIANIDLTHRGLGTHYSPFDHPRDPWAPFRPFLQNIYAFVLLYVLAITVAKFSIIFFLYRIFPIVVYRRFLLGCHAFVGLLGISAFLVGLFQCVPINAFWDRGVRRKGATCIDSSQFYIACGSLNAATNFVLLTVPIPLLWKLRTSALQKLVLTFIFILGLTVCAVGLTHVIMQTKLHGDDLMYNYVDTAIWSAAEPSIAVVCACLPSLRPLLARLILGNGHQRAISHPSQRSLSKSWISGSKDWDSQPSGNFNRLRESDSSMHGLQPPWLRNVAVSGGPKGEAVGESYGMEGRPKIRQSQYDVPEGGIRIKTTITVTETVDWRSDLF